ncbi:MAG TPA: Ku protein [Stellaceae bacterium]|jgi:DNA end-binding protein Ku|nr:Ku protein [Stellaceae bacterium]
MAPRSFWKGYLKLSLVTCPVAMMPVISASEKVRFHTLNAKTGNRIESRYVDAVTEKPVADRDQVRGYQTGTDSYLMLEDDEIASVALESTRTIDIEMFVPQDSISWLWYDQPHFLMPDDKIGEEAFGVIRDAMAVTKMVGISRVVLYRRERAVLLAPRDKGILLWTLRPGEELRDTDEYFEAIPKAKPANEALAMADRLIKSRHLDWNEDLVDDPVQERLLKLIQAKKKGRKPPTSRGRKAEPAAAEGNVINIMDALRRSLKEEKGAKR